MLYIYITPIKLCPKNYKLKRSSNLTGMRIAMESFPVLLLYFYKFDLCMLSEKELRTLGRKLTDKYIRENLSIDLSGVEGKTLRERLYNHFHPGPHLCAVCGNPVKFISFSKGYREYCSTQCQISVRAEKIRKTCLERYGRPFPKNVDKAKQTCLERYGVEHASQAQTIKDKAKQTCLERYGRTTGLNMEKSKMTCLERYGVEYTSQIPDVIEKIKATKLERHGAIGYNNRAKAKQTCLERYGVENTSQLSTIKDKIAQTCLERYDIENYMQSVALQNFPEIVEFDGTDWICKCPHPECTKCKEKAYRTPSRIHYDRCRLGVEPCTILLPIRSQYSSYEVMVREWLDELNIAYDSNRRDIIAPKELDIYLPDFNLAIEINGCYWHSVECKPRSYHRNKYDACKAKGITLITLWEDWLRDNPVACFDVLTYHLGMVDEITIPWNPLLVDLNLGLGMIKDHTSVHDEYECVDAGVFEKLRLMD